MDHIQSLLFIAAIYLATKVSPGPIFFVLSRHAMASSKRTALLIVVGVTIGSLIWATMSLLERFQRTQSRIEDSPGA